MQCHVVSLHCSFEELRRMDTSKQHTHHQMNHPVHNKIQQCIQRARERENFKKITHSNFESCSNFHSIGYK